MAVALSGRFDEPLHCTLQPPRTGRGDQRALAGMNDHVTRYGFGAKGRSSIQIQPLGGLVSTAVIGNLNAFASFSAAARCAIEASLGTATLEQTR